jgi:hypothetical protein
MNEATMTLRLCPLEDGKSTLIRATGTIVGTPQLRDIHRFMTILAQWSNGPVRVVLSVAGLSTDVDWAQLWDQGMCGLGRHQVDLHLTVRGISGSILVGDER